MTDFEALYRREYPRMVALAASMCGSREVGAELAQEALLRAYREWPRVSALDRPGAWVRRTTINLAIDAHRRHAGEQRGLPKIAPQVPVAEGFGIDDRFWVLVRALPERQSAVVALRYMEDLSLDDIAQILEVSVGTVKSTLFSAKCSLAASLGAEEVTE
ncbi:hypothetical protein BH10ACT2_BH10ACT2_22090 [soil metagenome]